MNCITLAAPHRHEIEVRKSRFLALAIPCESAEQALQWLAATRDANATHNCFAYRIGSSYRFSDDGEPGGTAGRPILAAIDGSGLDRVMVLVVRWFGGTKLGAGGLVRAYGGAAAECLRTAERREIIARRQCSVHCGFEHIGSLYPLMQAHAAVKLDEQHGSDGVHVQLSLAEHDLAQFTAALRDATRGQADCRVTD